MQPINKIDQFCNALHQVANEKNGKLYYNNQEHTVSADGLGLKFKKLFFKNKSIPLDINKEEDLLKIIHLYKRIIEELQYDNNPKFQLQVIDKFNSINKDLCKWVHLRPIRILDKSNESFEFVKKEMLEMIEILESRIQHPEVLSEFPGEILSIIADYDNRVGLVQEISEKDKARRERIFQGFVKVLNSHEAKLKEYGFFPDNAGSLDSETFCNQIFNKLNNALEIKVGIENGSLEPVDLAELLSRLEDFNFYQFSSHLIYLSGGDVSNKFNAVSLYSSGEKLYSIPENIKSAVNLQSIYLENNQLATISPEIGKLKNIKEISICNNLLTSLPDEIEQLSNLETLTLTNNRLTSLPEGLSKLKNLRLIDVRGNPINWRSLAKQLHENNVIILHD